MESIRIIIIAANCHLLKPKDTVYRRLPILRPSTNFDICIAQNAPVYKNVDFWRENSNIFLAYFHTGLWNALSLSCTSKIAFCFPFPL